MTKVFDFKNFTSDAGLYINGGTGLFQFADGTGAPVAGGTSTAGAVVANTYYQLTLTRTAAGVLTAYQNGTQAFQFTDSTGLATLNTMLSLFRDDGVGTAAGVTNEGTPAILARLRLYDSVLSQTQVAALVPEPANWSLLLIGTAAVGVWRRQRRETWRA